MTLGRLVFIVVLALLAYWAPQWMPRGEREADVAANPVLDSLKQLQARSRASEARKQEAFDRVLRDAETHRGSLSAEQLAMIEELRAARADESRRRVAGRLVNSIEGGSARTLSFGEWLAGAGAWIQDSYRQIQPRAEWSIWLIAVALVFTGFFGAILSFTHAARVVARLGFRLFRGWLVILSLLAIVIVVVTHRNPWTAFPTELMVPPLVALIGCALALRFVDFNYPVWNSLVRGCGAPLISMAFTAVYLKLVTLA
ncbi:MAG TPA: hypothetical protein VED01_22800 [Burkholderiales bacterium]|nr:hypothetical protein [Burkholderiales bacterium]